MTCVPSSDDTLSLGQLNGDSTDCACPWHSAADYARPPPAHLSRPCPLQRRQRSARSVRVRASRPGAGRVRLHSGRRRRRPTCDWRRRTALAAPLCWPAAACTGRSWGSPHWRGSWVWRDQRYPRCPSRADCRSHGRPALPQPLSAACRLATWWRRCCVTFAGAGWPLKRPSRTRGGRQKLPTRPRL